MKHKLVGLLLVIGAVILTAQARAEDFPACATVAAEEFAVPVKLFKAMALAEGWGDASLQSRQKAELAQKYGPMGLGAPAIPAMAKGLGVSVESVKQDACTNYRAAAWWFANRTGGAKGDLWAAVTQFYYGTPTRANAQATDRVKKIYADL